MPFKKGENGGSKGRPKGVSNKDTQKLRRFLLMVVDNNSKKFERELLKLTGKDFVIAFSNLFEYCTPKLQRAEMDITSKGKKIQLNITVPDKETKKLIEKKL